MKIATTKDIKSGYIDWKGSGIINPFEPNGEIAKLESYPKFAAYMESQKSLLSKRHIAKKNPANWYKTIDRIHVNLLSQEKLLIPDIKGEAQIVYEDGQLYPHHNLYHITSEEWDVKALQTLLSNHIAHLFVLMYSTKMRGGYLRFQAQYLRKIRVPLWQNLSAKQQEGLIHPKDKNSAVEIIKDIYKIRDSEWNDLSGVLNAA